MHRHPFGDGLFAQVDPGPVTLEDDVLVGSPIWTDVPETPAESLEDHELVRSFGFRAHQLLGEDGSPLPTADLETLLKAARAMRELGRIEASRRIVVGRESLIRRLIASAEALEAAAQAKRGQPR